MMRSKRAHTYDVQHVPPMLTYGRNSAQVEGARTVGTDEMQEENGRGGVPG